MAQRESFDAYAAGEDEGAVDVVVVVDDVEGDEARSRAPSREGCGRDAELPGDGGHGLARAEQLVGAGEEGATGGG